MIKVRVPGTSANIGPGFDSLGIAFKLYNEYIFDEIEYGVVFKNVEEEFANEDNIILKAMEKTFQKHNYKHKGISIEIIKQDVPVSRGLGSSSSCIVAGIIGALKIMNKKINKEEVLDIAVEIEGHPDNVAPSIFGGMIVSAVNKEKIYYNNVDIKDDIKYMAIIPDFKLSTTKAREVLPKMISIKDGVYNVSRASLLISAFVNGKYEILTEATKDRFHQNYRSKLIKGFNELYEESLKNKALGFFLSGAGPTMMCIIDKENSSFKDNIKYFLTKHNLNYKVLELTVDKEGATVLEGDVV